MKFRVLAIVLLSSLQYQFAFADITLNYSLLLNNSKQQLTYQIKDQQLKMSDSISDRINLFEQTQQQFISLHPETGKYSIINEKILQQRIRLLNQKRNEHIAEVEKKLNEKLKSMTPKEQEVGVSILNQLKYPDLYGEHTNLKVIDTNRVKTINDIECKVYQLSRKGSLLKEYCAAERTALKLNENEYLTLRGFYSFDYKTQSSLMLALGKSNFDLIDYDEKNIPGVIIEMISYKDKQIEQHLLLSDFHSKSLPDEIFKPSSSGNK